ncbi:MAG: hypothetical protein Q7J16_08210 [Candidatus Cloacimonadales bacterium]|nr:hypothetical protein [Candidatus Cloacimonadales bacterium]
MSKVPERKKDSPLLVGLINMFFEMIKHFFKDFENMKKVKKIDSMQDKFASLEHMLVRLEDKIQENRHQIEDLKNRILWGNIVIIVLLAIVIYQTVK